MKKLAQDITTVSSIVNQAEDEEVLHTWVSEVLNATVNFQLLWKGSKDGFSAKEFHGRCDHRGPTLTIIKSQYERVFGGFTAEAWGDDVGYKSDPRAFIFSLSHRSKCATQKNDLSINDDSRHGPIFGAGPDIQIYSNSNVVSGNFCQPHTYQWPDGADLTYFAGAKLFVVKEIEVYSVAAS